MILEYFSHFLYASVLHDAEPRVAESPEDRCRRVLTPHYVGLHAVIHEAWEQFMEIPESLRLPLMNPILRPTAIWAYMMAVAARTFTGVNGVRPIPAHNSVTYLIDDDVL